MSRAGLPEDYNRFQTQDFVVLNEMAWSVFGTEDRKYTAEMIGLRLFYRFKGIC